MGHGLLSVTPPSGSKGEDRDGRRSDGGGGRGEDEEEGQRADRPAGAGLHMACA